MTGVIILLVSLAAMPEGGYDWPSNVSELAVTVADTPLLSITIEATRRVHGLDMLLTHRTRA